MFFKTDFLKEFLLYFGGRACAGKTQSHSQAMMNPTALKVDKDVSFQQWELPLWRGKPAI